MRSRTAKCEQEERTHDGRCDAEIEEEPADDVGRGQVAALPLLQREPERHGVEGRAVDGEEVPARALVLVEQQLAPREMHGEHHDPGRDEEHDGERDVRVVVVAHVHDGEARERDGAREPA